MKNTPVKELKGKSRAELTRLLNEHREKLWTLKVDLTAGKVKNVREIHSAKRSIARILTLLKSAK